MENSKFVGAGPVSAHTSKIRQNKGITLIALVITIIVMLILVAVTISMAVNGGLFEYAGKAVGETQNEIDAEQQLANGKIKVGNTWYDSIDDYLNNVPSGTQNVEPDEEDGAGDGEEKTPSGDEKTYVEISELSVGDYVNYPVEYTNVASYTDSDGTDSYYPDEKFENKWRVLSTTEGAVRIVSAGVPLSYYHSVEDGAATTSVANLTTGFLTTEINSSTVTKYKFYKCGFNLEDGVNNLNNVFFNEEAGKFTEKVQSLTYDDISEITGIVDLYSKPVNGEDYSELLAVPCDDQADYYVYAWLASPYAWHDECLWRVDFYGNVSSSYRFLECVGSDLRDCVGGVRPVVSLKSSVKFSEADTKINGTTTWEISL